MASSSDYKQLAIQSVLLVIIVLLSVWLYQSITAPYEAVERAERLTEETRERLVDVRTVLDNYARRHDDQFPPTLDSLMRWVENDSLFQAQKDSILREGYNLDSLIFSPRSGEPFMYAVNDTARVPTYLLEDPDTRDHIGTLMQDVTERGATSWE